MLKRQNMNYFENIYIPNTTMSEHDWLVSIVFLSAMLVINFYYLAYQNGVLSIFGRKEMSWMDFFKLTILSLMPFCFTISLLRGPFNMSGYDSILINMFFLFFMLIFGIEIMRFISSTMRIVGYGQG